MAKKKKAQVLETKGVTISKEPSTVKGNRYSSYRITYYKEGRRCRERFRTEAAAQTRAQEVRKELEKGTIHIGTFTAKDHHVLVEALKILDKSGWDSGLLEAVRQVAEAKRLLDGKGTLMEAVRLFLSEAARKKLAVISFPDLVELFLVHIREKKKSRRYVLDMQARLHFAAKTFTANIADIKTAEMDKWLASMKKNTSRTKNNYRKAIRTLFRFGREKTTCPERRRRKRNSPPATTWGVRKSASTRPSNWKFSSRA